MKLVVGSGEQVTKSKIFEKYIYTFFLFSRSFEVLANAIGFKKSFSTSDILGIESSAQYSSNKPFFNLNRSHSEIQLSNYAPLFRLEASSRSLSTWVAVGDTSATTQLPSPQVSPLMTAPPLRLNVNKLNPKMAFEFEV